MLYLLRIMSCYLFVSMCFSIGLLGQPTSSDSHLIRQILAEDFSTEDIQLIEDSGVLKDLTIKELLSFDAFREVLALQKKGKGVKKINTNLSIQTLYTKNMVVDTTEYIYSNLRLHTAVKIGSIPFSTTGRLVAIGNKIHKNLSGISFDFDAPSFLNQFRSDLMPTLPALSASTLTKNLSTSGTSLINPSSLTNPIGKDWKPEELAVLHKEVKFQLYQTIVSHPTFIRLIKSRDSLQMMARATSEKVTKNLEETSAQIVANQEVVDSFLNRYQALWADRKTYYTTDLQALKQKMAHYAALAKKYNDPAYLRTKVLTNKKLSWGKRLLAATTQLNIGQSTLNDSWYVLKHLPISGVHYAFDQGAISGAIAIGRQQYQNQFTPIWSNELFSGTKGGAIVYMQAGFNYGKRNTLRYSFLSVKDRGDNAVRFIPIAQNNAVFSLSSNTQLYKNIQLKTSFGFSRTVWGSLDLDSSTKINSANSAYEVTLVGSLFNQQPLQVEVGYFYVGPTYRTSGNPFLQTNQQGMLTKASGQIGKTFDISTEFRVAQTVDENWTNGKQKELQLLGTFNWRPSNTLSITGQFSPNTFKYYGTGDFNTSNANWLYALQATTQKGIKQSEWIGTIGTTNFRGQLNYIDTVHFNNSNYLFTQQSIVLPSHLQFTLLVLGGQQTLADIVGKRTSFSSELSITYQRKKWDSTFGFQVQKDAYLNNWYYGYTVFQQVKIGQGGSLSTDISWQLPLQNTVSVQPRFWGSLKLNQRF